MVKKRVAIIGVTGAVGQEFVQSLNNHPWFEVTQIAASERSAGKKYLDAIKDANGIVAWDVGGEIPEYIKEMTVKSIDELDVSQLDLVFSAVESLAARDIETKMAADLPVISTSSAYRYENDVPILIPGINDEQTELLEVQKKNRNWKGWVAPLPNCTTTGLAITLKPLLEKYGAKKVMMTSMQAISGGGKSGVSAMGITDNILPYIPKEEGKVRLETRKILGKLIDGKIEEADIRISCTCTRVPVIDGHTESVFVETTKEIDPAKAKETYNQCNKDISVLGLPSAPKDFYAFHEDPTRPQPRMERTVGDGMTTTIGRVEKEELFDNGLKYMLFSHNKKMGSAKGAVLLAEMLYKKGKI
ncbi:MAG: aspartate-semialdehyde dehydrogenase [Nitrosopumilus sp.]|uniref:aspartate-semialdehyde dehydrogenase n=1 Tax=Nitrosopumilus sp. b3 TaxID=2109909 RepID=UPI0015F3C8C1|nr:aspartate-semialdehyde dehydrogenase [Nitrosopumilus sp. b3]KAF6248210.1 aspartate-semialdehyde dehydrogenase [Nitrosopumilus sp. b3]MBT8173085.1 aspartate-semialdehyde dehydrogenase [Nitrosopumilus sp.]MBT8252201.1 aspartate-semialdehyde dehydrogenase [Nitrosopumilus sp.]NNL53380.1 aspartate-semialdehyde dehydrogenase [Nitrosopumilus sp.]